MKYKMFLVVVGILLIGSIVAFSIPKYNSNPEQKQELTSSQIQKMIELGVIQVHKDLPNNDNDKQIGLIYKTSNGDCNLYQDIFGRYYCRW